MIKHRVKRIAIVGSAGVPASYGGFETLAENLLRYFFLKNDQIELIVFCSSIRINKKLKSYYSSKLVYIPLSANGVQSVLYDIISCLLSIKLNADVILSLGISGAIMFPLIRVFTSIRILTNIDGIEWKRLKWGPIAKFVLRVFENIAMRYSNLIIADNEGILDYIPTKYKKKSIYIPYGGDHLYNDSLYAIDIGAIPKKYALTICRIEPENNIEMIIKSFLNLENLYLMIIGNWETSKYGRKLQKKYEGYKNIIYINAVYDKNKLNAIREKCEFYVHGHSVGGTNPSLVEIMYFRKAIFAYDCIFNRRTTEDKAIYFKNAEELNKKIRSLNPEALNKVAADMYNIAIKKYRWELVSEKYFNILIS